MLYCLEMHLLSGGCRASEEVEGGSGIPKTVSILTCGGDYCNFVQDNRNIGTFRKYSLLDHQIHEILASRMFKMKISDENR